MYGAFSGSLNCYAFGVKTVIHMVVFFNAFNALSMHTAFISYSIQDLGSVFLYFCCIQNRFLSSTAFRLNLQIDVLV